MLIAILITVGLILGVAFCLQTESVDFRRIDTYIFFIAIVCLATAGGQSINYLFGERDFYFGHTATSIGIFGGGLTFLLFIIRHTRKRKLTNKA